MNERIVSDDQGNKYLLRDEPIHPWRWRGLVLWIVIFTGITFWTLVQNREAVHDLQINRARVTALRHTNCALQQFLLSARDARERAAVNETNPAAKRVDVAAARQYNRLAQAFTGSC